MKTNAHFGPLSPENEAADLGGLRKIHPNGIITDAEQLHHLWEEGIIAPNIHLPFPPP